MKLETIIIVAQNLTTDIQDELVVDDLMYRKMCWLKTKKLVSLVSQRSLHSVNQL